MTFKRTLMLSVIVGVVGGLSAYVLAWGLFTTHPELGMESVRARGVAMWVSPIAFLGSLIYFSARSRTR